MVDSTPDKATASAAGAGRSRFRPSREGVIQMTTAQRVEHDRRIALLRTRILREMRERGWNRLAITPVSAGAGATTLALDLARMIARHAETRVLLIDADLACPTIARRMGIEGAAAFSVTVRKGAALASLLRVLPEQDNLSVLAPAEPETAASEFVQDARFSVALKALAEKDQADVTLIDTAPLLGSDVGLATLPLVDAILLVSDGRATTAAEMKDCERLLADMPPLMGVVLNKTES